MSHRIYVAGGYADAPTAALVAFLLEGAGHPIACRWWGFPASVPMCERPGIEVRAIRTSVAMVVLDPHAGYGTATEMGIAMGRGIDVYRIVLAGTDRLAWFGPLVKTITVAEWDARTIADAVLTCWGES